MKERLEENGGFFFRFETLAEIEENLKKVLSPTAQMLIKTSMGKFCGERSYYRIAREIRSRKEGASISFSVEKPRKLGRIDLPRDKL